jgi:hypothetical protein
MEENEKPKNKGGRAPVSPARKFKSIHVTVSPAAFARYQRIPKNERSRRVSKFLERCDPTLILRDHGERETEE